MLKKLNFFAININNLLKHKSNSTQLRNVWSKLVVISEIVSYFNLVISDQLEGICDQLNSIR